jgi:hypothetical protein
MALPSTDGRTERPLPRTIWMLRSETIEHWYAEVDTAGDHKEATEKDFSDLIDGIAWEAPHERFFIAYLTREDGVREVEAFTYVLPLDATDQRPAYVLYEVWVVGAVTPQHRYYRIRLHAGTSLHRLAMQAWEGYQERLEEQLTAVFG